MLKIEAFEGRFAPVCQCDVCGDPITKANQGLVLYTSDPDGTVIANVDYKMVHKGECREKAIAKWGGSGGDDEVFTVLIYALNNMGWRRDDIRRLIEGIEDNPL